MTLMISDSNDKKYDSELKALNHIINLIKEKQNFMNILNIRFGAYNCKYMLAEFLISASTQIKISTNEYHRSIKDFNKIFSILSLILFKKKLNSQNIILISRDRLVEIKRSKKRILSDYLFWNFIEEYNQRHPKLKMILISNFLKTSDKTNIDMISTYNFISLEDLIQSVFDTLRIVFEWQKIRNSIKSRCHNNIELILFYRINSFFQFGGLMNHILISRSILNYSIQLRPKIIIANDDVMFLKPHILSNQNIKLLIIQSARLSMIKELFTHELIKSFNMEDMKTDGYAATGEYFRDVKLMSSANNNIYIIGQTRYDHIPNANKIYNKSIILKELELESNKQLLLWTTECVSMSRIENIQNVKIVYDAIKLNPKIQLVVKFHQGDEKYFDIFNESRPTNVKIISKKDQDIYELLYICDALITKTSTTAIEAVLFHKPIIVLNPNKDTDHMDYVEEGIALPASNTNELINAIDTLLINQSFNFDKNYDKYIQKYLYKNDGNATSRLISLVENMMLNKRM